MHGGIAVAAVLAAGLLAGEVGLLAAMLPLGIVASGEIFRLARVRGAHPVPLVGFAGVAGLYIAAYARGEKAPAALFGVVAFVLLLTFAGMIARRGRQGVTIGVAVTIFAVVFVGLLGAFLIALRRMPEPEGFRLVLALVLAAGLYDLGAAAVRKGGRAATVAGAAGVVAVVVVAGAALDPPFTWPRAIVLGLIVAGASVLGDRATALARGGGSPEDAARGGGAVVLERLDGLLIAAPLFFYAYRIFTT